MDPAGAYFAGAGVRYICVAGKAVTADRAAERRTLQRYAHSSYSQARLVLRLEVLGALCCGLLRLNGLA